MLRRKTYSIVDPWLLSQVSQRAVIMSCYEIMESRGRGGSRAVIMRGRGGWRAVIMGGCRASVIMGGWNSEGARIMRGGGGGP